MSKFIFLFLLLIFGILKVQSSSIFDSDSPPQLYSINDTGIIPSNSTDFQDILFNKDKITVFQFYNSWCGHCRRYAPFFKSFGRLINNWHQVVQVAAINCVEETNEEICRNYNVVSYPTVRLFWTNVNSQEDTGEHVENLEFSPEFLRDALVKFIVQNLKTKTAPKRWPNLNKIKLTGKEELNNELLKTRLNDAEPNRVPVVGIVEKNDSYVGQSIILELSNYRDKIEVLSLNIPSSNELNFTIDTSNKTALIQFEPLELADKPSNNGNSTYRMLATLPLTEKNQTEYYVNYIDQNLFDSKLRSQQNQQLDKPIITTSSSVSKSNQSVIVESMDQTLTLNDLYGSVSYTLHHQIPLKKKIDGRQLNILKRFFDILERYFSADDVKFIEFIKNLNQFLKSKEQELDINDYLNYLKKNDYDFKSKFRGWMTCKGSEPRYRGYTCSLWSLFHTLTVNEYLKEKDAQKYVNLHETLFAMRDYIANFFSCTDCAQHFGTMSQNLENELKLPNSSVLWLWQAHNRVNKRLKGDLTEDPAHPKNLYPYRKDCPSCYLIDGEFDEKEVFKYLIDRYGYVKKSEQESQPKTIEDVNPQSDKLTFESDPDSFKKSNKVFSYTDYSLIFALYVLIAAIVLSVFFYLPTRIKRKAKFTNKSANLNRYLDV